MPHLGALLTQMTVADRAQPADGDPAGEVAVKEGSGEGTGSGGWAPAAVKLTFAFGTLCTCAVLSAVVLLVAFLAGARRATWQVALILGLRTRAGVHPGEFAARTGTPLDDLLAGAGAALASDGWLEWADGRLRLSRAGLAVADEVFARLV